MNEMPVNPCGCNCCRWCRDGIADLALELENKASLNEELEEARVNHDTIVDQLRGEIQRWRDTSDAKQRRIDELEAERERNRERLHTMHRLVEELLQS